MSEDEGKKRFEAELRRLRMDEDIDALSGAGMKAEVMKLRALIRLHCKASGHDLCWYVPELWQALPEYRLVKPTIEVPPACEFLSKCREYRLSLDRVPAPTKAAETCSYCNGQGSDPKDGRCPLCRPYCERCDQRWDGAAFKDCPQCNPVFPKLEDRTKLKANEAAFVETMRHAAKLGVSYGRMMQLITWEWMNVAPTEALIPSHFEPASTRHPPEKVFSGRCGTCNACEIERIGCPCDGALDDGCFLCTPDRHARPPCPSA